MWNFINNYIKYIIKNKNFIFYFFNQNRICIVIKKVCSPKLNKDYMVLVLKYFYKFCKIPSSLHKISGRI
jgi:hypothetical protein